MGTYEHEEDMPKHQKIGKGTGHMARMESCHDMKKEASDQAYGQAGMKGCSADYKKIESQFFHSYTDDAGY
jgi:hypothetical protein